MPVNKETVLRVSKLARLSISGGEEDRKLDAFAAQMEQIVAYVDILETADTNGVEPLFSPMHLTAPPRSDEVAQPFSREEVLQNAPEQADGFFLVPRVI